MTFWSASDLEPTRKHRFRVELGGVVLWWAKSVTKPSFDISTNRYTAINHSIEYPGILTWNDVTLTIVDVGKKTKELYDKLKDMGYSAPGSTTDGFGGIEKGDKSDLKIYQMDASGKTIEEWTLNKFTIKTVNFGDLSYSDDELVEMSMTIAYDWAEFK
jgi:hypothetical protein